MASKTLWGWILLFRSQTINIMHCLMQKLNLVENKHLPVFTQLLPKKPPSLFPFNSPIHNALGLHWGLSLREWYWGGKTDWVHAGHFVQMCYSCDNHLQLKSWNITMGLKILSKKSRKIKIHMKHRIMDTFWTPSNHKTQPFCSPALAA